MFCSPISNLPFDQNCRDIWRWQHSVYPYIPVQKYAQRDLDLPSWFLSVWLGAGLPSYWPSGKPQFSFPRRSQAVLQRAVEVKAKLGLWFQPWNDKSFVLNDVNPATVTTDRLQTTGDDWKVLNYDFNLNILNERHWNAANDILHKTGRHGWTAAHFCKPLIKHRCGAITKQVKAF